VVSWRIVANWEVSIRKLLMRKQNYDRGSHLYPGRQILQLAGTGPGCSIALDPAVKPGSRSQPPIFRAKIYASSCAATPPFPVCQCSSAFAVGGRTADALLAAEASDSVDLWFSGSKNRNPSGSSGQALRNPAFEVEFKRSIRS
jgi:hypothetical protein